MPMVSMLLAVLALICFLLGTFNAQVPGGTRSINWMSAGLALCILIYLMR